MSNDTHINTSNNTSNNISNNNQNDILDWEFKITQTPTQPPTPEPIKPPLRRSSRTTGRARPIYTEPSDNLDDLINPELFQETTSSNPNTKQSTKKQKKSQNATSTSESFPEYTVDEEFEKRFVSIPSAEITPILPEESKKRVDEGKFLDRNLFMVPICCDSLVLEFCMASKLYMKLYQLSGTIHENADVIGKRIFELRKRLLEEVMKDRSRAFETFPFAEQLKEIEKLYVKTDETELSK
jgi:hypothetical protein